MGRGPGCLHPDGLASGRSFLGAYSEACCERDGSSSLWVQLCVALGAGV